jgi:hypothetical protein
MAGNFIIQTRQVHRSGDLATAGDDSAKMVRSERSELPRLPHVGATI